jgi:hypothetical protein
MVLMQWKQSLGLLYATHANKMILISKSEAEMRVLMTITMERRQGASERLLRFCVSLWRDPWP